MGNNRSVLRFEKYIVKEISYLTNEMFKDTEEIELDFDFDEYMSLNAKENKIEIELSADIFKDSIKKNYPFEMKVTIKGYFSIDAEETDKEVQMFEQNAIAILFPYLRAIVSTYTANANVVPVILPAMNINAYMRRKYQNGGKQV
jgi:preprotein translocase subunit SecB